MMPPRVEPQQREAINRGRGLAVIDQQRQVLTYRNDFACRAAGTSWCQAPMPVDPSE